MLAAFLQLTLVFFFFLGSVFSLSLGRRSETVKDFLPPPPQIENYSFGLRFQLADLFWVRAIQDFDFCESLVAKKTCRGQSWLFQILDAATRLDASYYPVYSHGGLALTVIISDYEGASLIFDRGVENFPDRWQLLYRAGYHALYEERNFAKAADLYRRAGENGGPQWLPKLVQRLEDPALRLELAERMLSDLRTRQEDAIFIEKMEAKIEELRAQLARGSK
jgi:hypothetical protein